MIRDKDEDIFQRFTNLKHLTTIQIRWLLSVYYSAPLDRIGQLRTQQLKRELLLRGVMGEHVPDEPVDK